MIDITMVTCNRVNFLKQAIKALEDRLKTPYRLIVIDNTSSDGTGKYLKKLKATVSYPVEIIYNEKPVQLSQTSTQGFQLVESDIFITTMDDIIIPDLEPDILERLIEMIKRRDDLGAICLRTAQMKRKFPQEDEVMIVDRACPAYFRIQRKSDIEKAGGFGVGRWEDNQMVNICKDKLNKKAAIATDLWAKDIGASPDRGYPTWYREQLKTQKMYQWGSNDRPVYIDPNTILDPKTNKPI